VNHLSLADSVLISQDIAAQIASAGVNGTAIDMKGWDGCLFIFNLGTMASGATFDARIMSSANSNFSGNANVTNASIVQVTNAGNANIVMIDVYRSGTRYLKSVTTPATANTTFGSLAVRYRQNGILPPTQVAAQIVRVVEPA
jgi:hypothetical protein